MDNDKAKIKEFHVLLLCKRPDLAHKSYFHVFCVIVILISLTRLFSMGSGFNIWQNWTKSVLMKSFKSDQR